jgi:hypothetical protein
LLWHLNETANGAVQIAGSGDAVPAVINGVADSDSTSADGRFDKGRVKANIVADTSTALTVGTGSFTIECWMKGGSAVTRAYTLVGKEDSFGGSQFNPEYSLRVTPTGGLRAYIYDTSFRLWRADMAGKVFDPVTNRYLTTLNDGLWHYVAMVSDRASGQLTLYVDGAARASGTIPANFGPVYSSPTPLRVGHWAFFEDNAAGGPEEFPGTIDEVRMQNFARTATQIADTWYGTNNAGGAMFAPDSVPTVSLANQPTPAAIPSQPQLLAASVTPNLIERNKGIMTPQVTNLTIEGANLKDVGASVTRDGEPLKGVVAEVRASSESTAQVVLKVAPDTPLGPAQLLLTRRGYRDAIANIRVIEPSEFALESDTLGLWHLNEGADDGAHLIDASEHALNLTGAQTARIAEGRFGSGRTLARATADANNEALSLGASSFTVESWIKTATLDRDRVLIAKEAADGSNTEFRLTALSSGALRAEVFDLNGLLWQAETLPATTNIADDQWHSVAFVVDREGGVLAIYMDGAARSVVPAPPGFAAVRNLGQPLVFGSLDAAPNAASARSAGLIDELRISSTAHSPDKIGADFFGHDEPQVTLIRPATIATPEDPLTLRCRAMVSRAQR